jgi:glutaryl-CoA dehydrogenase
MTSIGPYPDFFQINDLLTTDQRLAMESVRSFVKKEVEPVIRDAYLAEVFPEHLPRALGEMGLLGAHLKGYGLPGLDPISYGLIMQELERCDSGLRSFASVQGALVMYPISAFGSEDQKQYWLPRLASGISIGCFGLTESQGGSDPGAMLTVATKKDGGWLLNGSKTWITNGSLAEVAVVWAQTEEGIRAFLVHTKSKGVSIKKMTGKLSLRASVTCELFFDKVRLEKESILPGAVGLKSALKCLTQARYGISWGVLGAAEACFDEAVSYVSDRKTFGRSLGHNQLIQRKLAIMLSRLTQAKLLAFRLGQLLQSGKMHHSQVSLAKQNNVEVALETARTSRDILGANGIMIEYASMRHLCNLETVYTYEGTNDIHLLVLGAEITGKPAFGA